MYKANANALGDMATPLRETATKLASSGERVHNTVHDFDWQGQARDAAAVRADRELTQDRIVAADMNALADAYENGRDTMQPIIDGLKAKAQGLEADHFAVSEDWVVTDTYDYAAAKKLATLMGLDDSAINALQAQRANEAATETGNLQRLADALGTADADTAAAINNATAALTGAGTPLVLPPGLARGQVANLGPVAGTGANIPGIGAADLGEIIQLPNGQYVAVLGDSYRGNRMGEGQHFPSVAVPVTFDAQGRAHFGAPLTGPDGANVLFPLPQAAKDAGANNALPAGSVTTRDGRTYMMVVGTNTNEGLAPKGGSWLVEVTNNPAGGWKPIEASYKPWASITNPTAGIPGEPPRVSDPIKAPTQISGYQGKDGTIYIAADGFDRHQGVTMYRVDPDHITDRNAWQPWTGTGWGQAGETSAQQALRLSGDNFGELSFRELGGKPVLSGFNGSAGNTEVHVGSGLPTQIFDNGRGQVTVVAAGGPWGEPGAVPQNYGGYIMPGATLDNMRILVSQWNTTPANPGIPYTVEQFQVNPNQ
ncbi:hypothetical protein MPRG_65560 [Mycobacterium paragordonae]|uniref:DUF4185 domain-containing protein n=1 Tax=Mycobacterium paragordonae TaxID=1389713 RepID=A0ABQ1CFR1_9MYCO|nr:hypothetical protein MPRG_65560 [Mycobacterium paragordonae]